MRPEGRIVAAETRGAIDHALVIAAIPLVADSGTKVDGRDLAHVIRGICTGIPEGSLTPEEVALLAVTIIDAQAG